jgi:hypothetical protein
MSLHVFTRNERHIRNFLLGYLTEYMVYNAEILLVNARVEHLNGTQLV